MDFYPEASGSGDSRIHGIDTHMWVSWPSLARRLQVGGCESIVFLLPPYRWFAARLHSLAASFKIKSFSVISGPGCLSQTELSSTMAG